MAGDGWAGDVKLRSDRPGFEVPLGEQLDDARANWIRQSFEDLRLHVLECNGWFT